MESDRLKTHFLRQVGAALREIREEGAMTRTQLAGRVGVSPDVIERAEGGDLGDITLEEFVNLALICGYVPLDLSMQPVDEVTEFSAQSAERVHSVVEFERWRLRRDIQELLARSPEASPR